MSKDFPLYTTDYISGVLSLRKPQKQSLKILEDIVKTVPLLKTADLKKALSLVHKKYKTCTDFERQFMSLTFALATGVGKTRLMGAFIAYLYTQQGIRNFFVVTPNTTIYEKLKSDLSDTSSSKYVFAGMGCFSMPPEIITDDDYREKSLSLFASDINIFIYNIDKFNKEDSKMKKVNEHLGDSFYQYLSSLSDLVLIMDESHHYRAERGAQVLNELHPILGVELTATPLVKNGSKQVPFKNVVYEYPLSKAIEDGYTRTPFALTRSDIDFYNFGDEQLDKMMLIDGISNHENVKRKLQVYAENYGKRKVKPFMLIVCRDTGHATWVEKYITSDEFCNGAYRNKTVIVHSKQRGAESDENTRLLLNIENSENPIEIVIHVNMLKEGWDVNNLYTIVPLRTATSKILREQMVGRGLRLPYGQRTGDREVDAVMLTAHNKFKELIEEAQKGDSIFKAGNVIHAEEIESEEVIYVQPTLSGISEDSLEKAYEKTKLYKSPENDKLLKDADNALAEAVSDYHRAHSKKMIEDLDTQNIVSNTIKKLEDKWENTPDLGDVFKSNQNPLLAWISDQAEEKNRNILKKYIPIPRIKIIDSGNTEYVFLDFELDLSEFTHTPIQNDVLIQSLIDPSDQIRLQGEVINFEGYNPEKVLMGLLREKPEIDYQKCSVLLRKLILTVCKHYRMKYQQDGLQNIIMMNKRNIVELIYKQMLKHFYCDNGLLKEEVIGVKRINISPTYSAVKKLNLYDNYQGEKIRTILFEGIQKGVFEAAKFDSFPELLLARILEQDVTVVNWLRPSPQEFDITYNHGHRYVPDFVVETTDSIYLVEVKGEDKLQDPDVIAKRKRAVQFCAAASCWGKVNGYKEWCYLFIPSKQIMPNSSFFQLSTRFKDN